MKLKCGQGLNVALTLDFMIDSLMHQKRWDKSSKSMQVATLLNSLALEI
jgi:hypothetical protein